MERTLVGRDADCAVLRRALAAALGRRRPPVVLVSGEGGVGKTTLVEHVLACTGTPVLSGQGSLLKLGCRTRADAVRRLAELGTLPPDETTRGRP
jgi:predicted ATPase